MERIREEKRLSKEIALQHLRVVHSIDKHAARTQADSLNMAMDTKLHEKVEDTKTALLQSFAKEKEAIVADLRRPGNSTSNSSLLRDSI